MTENGFTRTDDALKCVRCHTEYPIRSNAATKSGIMATDINGVTWCAQALVDKGGCLYCGLNANGRTFVRNCEDIHFPWSDPKVVTVEHFNEAVPCYQVASGTFRTTRDAGWFHEWYRPETKIERAAREPVVEQAQTTRDHPNDQWRVTFKGAQRCFGAEADARREYDQFRGCDEPVILERWGSLAGWQVVARAAGSPVVERGVSPDTPGATYRVVMDGAPHAPVQCLTRADAQTQIAGLCKQYSETYVIALEQWNPESRSWHRIEEWSDPTHTAAACARKFSDSYIDEIADYNDAAERPTNDAIGYASKALMQAAETKRQLDKFDRANAIIDRSTPPPVNPADAMRDFVKTAAEASGREVDEGSLDAAARALGQDAPPDPPPGWKLRRITGTEGRDDSWEYSAHGNFITIPTNETRDTMAAALIKLLGELLASQQEIATEQQQRLAVEGVPDGMTQGQAVRAKLRANEQVVHGEKDHPDDHWEEAPPVERMRRLARGEK